MTDKFIISIDIGTTVIKVGLFNTKGIMLGIEVCNQDLIFPGNNLVEQSPEGSWRIISNLIKLMMKNHNVNDVKAISLSVQRGTVIPLDQNGNPITNLIVWMDKRGMKQVEWLNNNIGIKEYYDISGHGISHITGISKLLWFKNESNQLWEKVNVLGTPQTLFLKWLGCENFVCDLSSGTYFFPFDIYSKNWSSILSEKLDFPKEKLPNLVRATEIVGYLSPYAAKSLGLKPGIALVAGGGDGQCAAAGSGAISPGITMINIGTGAGVQSYVERPIFDPKKIIPLATHVVAEAWEMEAHTQASGAVLRWLKDKIFNDLECDNQQMDPYDYLIEHAKNVKLGSEGLLLIPTFNGSTAPFINLNAKGILFGLSLHHQKNHILRSFLEGISFEICWMLDSLIKLGIPINEIRLVGGGSKNPFWNQIHADILNQPIYTLKNNEAALVGSAMCAAVAIGEFQDLSEATERFVSVKDLIEPIPNNVKQYDVIYNLYKKIFTTICCANLFD